MDKKILFVDVDNTFVNFNTTFKFINLITKKNKLKKIIYNFSNSFFFKVLYKIKLYDSVYLAYKLLKNISKNNLEIEAKNFVDHHIDEKSINSKCLNIINEKKRDGFEIILLSNSLDLIVKNIMIKYKFHKYYSNNLLFKNEKCSGMLSFYLRKSDIVKKYFKITNDIYIITDNIEDIDCTNYSKKSYIVINNKNKKFWHKNKKNNYEFIY